MSLFKLSKADKKISKNGKNIFIILGSIIVILLFVLYILPLMKSEKNNSVDEKQGNIKINNNKGINEKKEVNGFTFSNTSIIYDGDLSTITTTITNNSGNDYSKEGFIIAVKNKDGKVITNLEVYLVGVLKNNSSKVVTSSIDMDLSSIATSLEFVEKDAKNE